MTITGSRILLTGATGGIGRELALQLARHGARLALAGRDQLRLEALTNRITTAGGDAAFLLHDLARPDTQCDLVRQATEVLGGLDVLINNAGVSRFMPYEEDDAASISALMTVNLVAPMLLTRCALEHFRGSNTGHIVNIGSALGALGLPFFSAYSASKFGLRGFSEALRRELAGSDIKVTYVAPRTTATGMNSDAVRALMAESGAKVDDPGVVAETIINALAQGRNEVHIGWPERLLVRLNALLPRLVDRALAGNTAMAARHVRSRPGEACAPAPRLAP